VETKREPASVEEPVTAPLQVLLVEDNYPDARIFELALRAAAFPVRMTVAGDGETAARLLEQHAALDDPARPHLVVTDLNIPRTSGHELLRAIKASPVLRALPVVVFSSSRNRADVEQSYREGASSYIRKPVDADDFFAVVEAFVEYWAGVVSLPERPARVRERPATTSGLVEHSGEPILTKDLSGRILTWSPLAEHLYGYTAEEAIGRPVSTLVPPESLEELGRIMDSLRRGRPIHGLRTVRVRKDGRRIAVVLTISPLTDHEGNVVGAATVAREIE
jgi:PAS domain S-box-containing protein